MRAGVLRRLEGHQYEPRVGDEQKEPLARAEDAPQPREQRGHDEYEPDQRRPGQPGQQLLFGEPGAGKTALLNAAGCAASEAGPLVLRASGVEFEADLPFAGLHQVLLRLLDEFGRLSRAHRDALSAALGYGEGPPPDRLLVSTATLTVLRQAATASPVLVIVDDLPWLELGQGTGRSGQGDDQRVHGRVGQSGQGCCC